MPDSTPSITGEDDGLVASTTVLEVNGVTVGVLESICTTDGSTYCLAVRGRTRGSVTVYDAYRQLGEFALGGEPIAWVGTTEDGGQGVDVSFTVSLAGSESDAEF